MTSSNRSKDPSSAAGPPDLQQPDASRSSASQLYDPEFVAKLQQAGSSWRKEAEGSLFARVLLTLTWGFGFYLVSIVLGLGLMVLPFFVNFYYVKLIVLSVGFGATLLAAIAPRFDRFVAPGPELFEKDHPHLFRMIADVAHQLGTSMPHHVYLVLDVNAFVAYRGGIFGFGSKKIMGLGLPLLHTLTIAELQAVIAHEFGHFIGGDVALGSWIYKIRQSMIRTVSELKGNPFQKLFIFFTRTFLQLSQSISRRQEYQADSVAAKLMGANVLIASLDKLDGTMLAFDSYMDNEYGPALGGGLRPPLGDGFQTYYQSAYVQDQLREILNQQDKTVHQDPFDSHPNNTYRYQAAMRFPPKAISDSQNAFASCLLGKPVDQEQKLLAGFLNKSYAKNPAVSWQEMGLRFYQPIWREEVLADEVLQGLQVSELPLYLKDRDLVSAAYQHTQTSFDEDFWSSISSKMVFALGTVLTAKGWVLLYQPGYRFCMAKGSRQIILSELLEQALVEPKAKADWERLIEDERLAGKTVGAFLEEVALPKLLNTPLPSSDTDPGPVAHQINPAVRFVTILGCVIVGVVGGIWTLGASANERIPEAITVGGLTVAMIALPFLILKWLYSTKPGYLALTELGFTLKSGKKEWMIDYAEIQSLVFKQTSVYKDEKTIGELYRLTGTTSAGPFQMVHFDETGHPFFGSLISKLLERYAQSLLARISSGELVRTKNWMADSEFLTIGRNKVPWSSLLKPLIVDNHLVFWKENQVKPFAKLAIHSDRATTLYFVAETLSQATQVNDARGGLIAHHAWNSGLLITLTLLPIALGFFPFMLQEDTAGFALFFGLIILACGLRLMVHYGKGVVIYTEGVSLKKWYRESFLALTDICSIKVEHSVERSLLRKRLFTYEILLRGHGGEKLLLKGRVIDHGSSSFLILKEMMSLAIADHIRTAISNGETVEWVAGVTFHEDRLEVSRQEGKKEIFCTIPYTSCNCHFGDEGLVVFPEGEADKAIHISFFEENFYPGLEVLRSFLS